MEKASGIVEEEVFLQEVNSEQKGEDASHSEMELSRAQMITILFLYFFYSREKCFW